MSLLRSLHRGRPARKPRLERLEDRTVPTATLFVDFGDAFPVGGLQMSVQELRDDFLAGIQGPDLNGLAPGLADGTNLRFTPLAALGPGTALRANVLTLLQRYYDPLDVDIVVTSNANILGIQIDLLFNGAGNDNYVFVTDVVRLDTGAHVGANIGANGIAAEPDILARANNRDDTAVVFADLLLATYPGLAADTAIADTLAHEAGHNFGLEHLNPIALFTDADLLTRSELMRRGGIGDFKKYNLNMFSDYPLLADNPATGVYSPLLRLLNDPNVGPRPGSPAYVTGTGAHDLIVITDLGGGVALVQVEAFRTPLRLPGDAIFVPGGGGALVFPYLINTANGILIDAGAGADQVVIDANLNTFVEVRGMEGADQLVVNNNGAAAAATYTPDPFTVLGQDEFISFSGTVVIGGTVVQFEEYEPTGAVFIQGVPAVTLTASAGNDNLTIAHPVLLAESVAGSVAGVPIVPLIFAAPPGSALTVDMGLGNDIVSVIGTDLNLSTTVLLSPGVNIVTVGGPVSGLFDVLGPLSVVGAGGPTAAVFNDQANPFNTTYTITDFTVSRPGWTMVYAGLVSLTFNGGSGNNVYNIFSTAFGTATTINAGIRNDIVNIGNPVVGLNGILGSLWVNGGAGILVVNLDDRAFPDTVYTVTPTTISRPGVLFTFAGVQVMNLLCNFTDIVIVLGLPPGMVFNVIRS
jgi:hypothetical protein